MDAESKVYVFMHNNVGSGAILPQEFFRNYMRGHFGTEAEP